jgi:heavy metal-binding protein
MFRMRLRPTALLALLIVGGAFRSARAQGPQSPTPVLSSADEAAAYVCPMHPDYISDIVGKCPRCGMDLVLAAPYDTREYRLDVQTVPAVIKAGEPATLRFKIFHPGTGDAITNFEVVHDKRYHLFVLSQNMEFFQHIHPDEQADGTWSINVTLPKPGYYKALSDFLPSGGSSQFISRQIVTAGYTGDLVGDSAQLVPDTVYTKTVDDLTATVVYEPATLVAGLFGHLRFSLTDTKTSRPVTDLQTYLGAFGHSLIMSEDMVDYVHSHPIDLLPAGTNLEDFRGGPTVTFEGLMPKPGRYRAWTQFRRNNKVYTFVSTFQVMDPEESPGR